MARLQQASPELWPTKFGVSLVLLYAGSAYLVVRYLGLVLGADGWFVVLGFYVLFPGVAALIASRARSDGSIIAAGTLLLGFVCAWAVVALYGVPLGPPNRRMFAFDAVLGLVLVAGTYVSMYAALWIMRLGGATRQIFGVIVGAALGLMSVALVVIAKRELHEFVMSIGGR